MTALVNELNESRGRGISISPNVLSILKLLNPKLSYELIYVFFFSSIFYREGIRGNKNRNMDKSDLFL